ncbi:hypothetical protein DV735_g5947, partial [Chaetothyriales sp. CBS 134920]
MDMDTIAMENIAMPQPHPDFQVLADYLRASEETSTKKIIIHVYKYSSVFDSKFRQQADEQLKVVPLAESKSKPNHGYSSHMTEPLLGILYNFLTFFINQPYNKAAGKFIEGPFPLGKIINAPDGQVLTPEQIHRHPAIKVRITLEQPTNVYQHQVNGLRNLAAEEHTPLSAILISSQLSQVKLVSIYRDILDRIPEPQLVMGPLNTSQEAIIQQYQAAVSGLVLCHRPPSTGKTYLARNLVAPFVQHTHKQDQPLQSVLYYSTSNKSINTLAVGVNQMICEGLSPLGTYLVHIHTHETKMAITRQIAVSKNPAAMSDQVKQVEDVDNKQIATLQGMMVALSIHQAYHTQHTSRFPSIVDTHITTESFNLSVGRHIMQLISKIPSRHNDPQPDTNAFTRLMENYAKFASGNIVFTPKQHQEFQTQLKEAKDYILANTAVVCTTPALTSNPKVYNTCNKIINLVLMDKAAPNQTYFQAQWSMSLLERLVQTRFPSTMLHTQYRMCPDIAQPISRLRYSRKLINNPSVLRENQPLAMEVHALNHRLFSKEGYIMFFDIPTKYGANTQVMSGSGSRYNVGYIKLAVSLAKTLMDTLPHTSVAILTGYSAQQKLYLQAKNQLVQHNPKYANLIIDTINHAQGIEVDIGIKDLLVTPQSGSFLNQAYQTNRWSIIFNDPDVDTPAAHIGTGVDIMGELAKYSSVWLESLSTVDCQRELQRALEEAQDNDKRYSMLVEVMDEYDHFQFGCQEIAAFVDNQLNRYSLQGRAEHDGDLWHGLRRDAAAHRACQTKVEQNYDVMQQLWGEAYDASHWRAPQVKMSINYTRNLTTLSYACQTEGLSYQAMMARVRASVFEQLQQSGRGIRRSLQVHTKDLQNATRIVKGREFILLTYSVIADQGLGFFEAFAMFLELEESYYGVRSYARWEEGQRRDEDPDDESDDDADDDRDDGP